MENLPIMLLIITNVEDAAALLIYAYQQGWLDTASVRPGLSHTTGKCLGAPTSHWR